jgi:hypothetical protein
MGEDDNKGGGLRVWIGFILYLLAGGVLLTLGLIMPIWAVLALTGVWVMGLTYLLLTWRTQPNAVLIMPFVMVGLYFLVAWLGDVFLDWNA